MCTKFKDNEDGIAFAKVIDKDDYKSSRLLLLSKNKNIVIETKNIKEALRPAYGLSLQKLDDNDNIVLGTII